MLISFIKSQTVLSVYIMIYYLIVIVFSILRWKILSTGEGWGVVAMFGLLVMGALLIVIEVLLRRFIKNLFWLNSFGTLSAIIFSYILFIEQHNY